MAPELKEYELIQSDLANLGTEIKGLLNTQNEDIRKNGAAATATAKGLDKANERYEKLQKDKEGLEQKQTELFEKIGGIEKKLARAGMLSAEDTGSPASVTSLGSLLTKSDEFKKMCDERMSRSAPIKFDKKNIIVPGLMWHPSHAQKKEIALGTSDVGALIPTFRWDQVIQSPLRSRRLIDLMRTIMTSLPTIEYPEETITHELVACLASQAAAAQKAVVLDRASTGFYPGQSVVLEPGVANEETIVIDTIDHDTLTITAVSNLTKTHAAGTKASSDTFVFTPEATIKPLSEVGYTLRTATVKTLATIMPFAKQMLEDATALESLVDSRMREFLELSKERQILYGDNSNDQMQGILTHPDIHSYLWSSGIIGDTKLDAIRRASTLAMLSFLPPDGVTVHPNDWEDIELTKGTDGHYIFLQIPTGSGVTSVWRLSVVESSVIDEATALVGSYGLGSVLWMRSEAEVSVSDQNRDWWEKNMIGFRVEERCAQSVIRPKAFVDLTFDNAPS
jgi:hypothetical protein